MVWHSGGTLVFINVVNLYQAQLVLGLVMIHGFRSLLHHPSIK